MRVTMICPFKKAGEEKKMRPEYILRNGEWILFDIDLNNDTMLEIEDEFKIDINPEGRPSVTSHKLVVFNPRDIAIEIKFYWYWIPDPDALQIFQILPGRTRNFTIYPRTCIITMHIRAKQQAASTAA